MIRQYYELISELGPQEKVKREIKLFPKRYDRRNPFHKYVLEAANTEQFYKMDFETCVRNLDPACVWAPGSTQRKGDHSQQTLYFCTHGDNQCLTFDSEHAAQVAKFNVEKCALASYSSFITTCIDLDSTPRSPIIRQVS
jgi:hypothetical protein